MLILSSGYLVTQCVFLTIALVADRNHCSDNCSCLYMITGMIKNYYVNIILERTIFRQFYCQFSMHSYANLELHNYQIMLMICSSVRNFSLLNGLKEYTGFFICGKCVSVEVALWKADVF